MHAEGASRVKRLCIPLLVLAVLLGAMSLGSALPAADSAILFIGDGMGPGQVRLGRAAGGGDALTMERMPYSGLVTTVSAGGEITDSAAASTALATGYKTENGMLGMMPDRKKVETILERCRQFGKSAGIVTNEAVTGATPSGFAVHVPDRGLTPQIAQQLVESGAQVMMGYGRDGFVPAAEAGAAKGGPDLAAELRKKGYQIVYTRDELAKSKDLRLVGLFDEQKAPALPEMVRAALARLNRDDKGFFLIVEQAKVDWKDGDPSGVALDVLELDKAVQAALDYARHRGRTLVLVAADHETGGLQIQNQALLATLKGVKASAGGIAGRLDRDRTNIKEIMKADAGIDDLTDAELNQVKSAKDAEAAIGAVISQRTGLKWTAGHTATPVRVFAFGPGAEQFTGEMDNTDIPKRIAAVLGLGPFAGSKQ
jgi:alkaline phosphatase